MFNQSTGSNSNDSASNQSSMGSINKNHMSQSSGANGNGFDNRSQITDRLQLLKSSNKYKTKFDAPTATQDATGNLPGPSSANNVMLDQYSEVAHSATVALNKDAPSKRMIMQDSHQKGSYEDDTNSTGIISNGAQSHGAQNQKRPGPIKAAHLKMPSEEIK